ncbi:MAG: DUF5320 domain-containing protein [Thermodesulfobacteriota bacterium]|nr:DUF5320 domain-containing protein [Thermodesulfobacteriota bacterium]
MPGFDGTGPMGQGPMTGGGRGFCAMPYRGYGAYGYGMRTPYYPPYGGSPFYGRPFYGPVFGAGRGGLPWGGGRGRVFGGGRALNHVRFRTAMDPTWYMGFRRGW